MSDKKVLGMSLFGIVKSSEPWKKAHEIGMKELSERAKMPELIEKVDSEHYFNFVKKALEKIDEYKDLPENERVSLRRSQYFDRVFDLIKLGDYIDEDFVSFLKELKEIYSLVLITTNSLEFVEDVLKFAHAEDLFENIITLDPEEEDDKELTFDKAMKELKKLDLFVGNDRSGEACRSRGIEFIKYKGLDEL
ncbi:MAG: HAD family hydrolase, partial [Nanoarchaeota archaeon]|nr:HAD family hydrolase [Nanoarchaeota archaeon]